MTDAEVTFFTTSDGKELENCLSLGLYDNNGKQVGFLEKFACGASSGNHDFASNRKVTITFYNVVDKTAVRSAFDNIKLKVLLYALWGNDIWKFKPKVVLYFSDGSTLTKQSGEQYVAAKGADMFTGFFDENTTVEPGIIVITDWQ